MLIKAPEDVLDYDVDFARWLPESDVLDTATTEVTGSSLTVTSIDVSQTQVRVWVEGGAATETAEIELVVTTAQGRTKSVCFRIRIKDC